MVYWVQYFIWLLNALKGQILILFAIQSLKNQPKELKNLLVFEQEHHHQYTFADFLCLHYYIHSRSIYRPLITSVDKSAAFRRVPEDSLLCTWKRIQWVSRDFAQRQLHSEITFWNRANLQQFSFTFLGISLIYHNFSNRTL